MFRPTLIPRSKPDRAGTASTSPTPDPTPPDPTPPTLTPRSKPDKVAMRAEIEHLKQTDALSAAIDEFAKVGWEWAACRPCARPGAHVPVYAGARLPAFLPARLRTWELCSGGLCLQPCCCWGRRHPCCPTPHTPPTPPTRTAGLPRRHAAAGHGARPVHGVRDAQGGRRWLADRQGGVGWGEQEGGRAGACGGAWAPRRAGTATRLLLSSPAPPSPPPRSWPRTARRWSASWAQGTSRASSACRAGRGALVGGGACISPAGHRLVAPRTWDGAAGACSSAALTPQRVAMLPQGALGGHD